VPKKVFVLSKVEPGSKCSASQSLRSFQVEELPPLDSFRRGRRTLTSSIFDREANAGAVPILANRLIKAKKIHSEVTKPETISSYETEPKSQREQLCQQDGTLAGTMSLENPAFWEEVESLHTEGMGETGPSMEIPLRTPGVGGTQGVKRLLPKPTQGKKILYKNINPSNQEICTLPDDHDYTWNIKATQQTGLSETNQLFGDLPEIFPDLVNFEAHEEPMNKNQVHNQAISNSHQVNQYTISAENNNTAQEIIEEIVVPVQTADQKPTQYVIIKEVSNEGNIEISLPEDSNQGTCGAMSVNDEWSAQSLFPELNILHGEDDLTAHNPQDVTGQAIFEDAKPEVQENPFTASGDMDLLKTLLDDTIGVESEEFQNFVKVDNPEPEVESTIKFEDYAIPSTSRGFPTSGGTVEVKEEPMDVDVKPDPLELINKRGRGRPRVPRTPALVEPARRPRGRPPSTPMYAQVEKLDYESSSAMSSEEQKDFRYKRMRELNNAASKRCRINRKRKFEDMETEQTLQAARNIELKNKVAELESQVSKFKTAIFDMIKRRKTEQVQVRPEQVQPRLEDAQALHQQVQMSLQQVQAGPEQVQALPQQVQMRPEQVQTSPEQVQLASAATSNNSLSTIDDSAILSFDWNEMFDI